MIEVISLQIMCFIFVIRILYIYDDTHAIKVQALLLSRLFQGFKGFRNRNFCFWSFARVVWAFVRFRLAFRSLFIRLCFRLFSRFYARFLLFYQSQNCSSFIQQDWFYFAKFYPLLAKTLPNYLSFANKRPTSCRQPPRPLPDWSLWANSKAH